MSVTLLRAYGNYTSGSVVTLDSETESALVTQGFATAITTGGATAVSRYGDPDMAVTQGGNVSIQLQSGIATPTYDQGPRRLVAGGMTLGSAALTGYETSGVAQTAGTFNIVEIYVPYTQTWTGIGVLNGTTVGTNKYVCALWGSSGALMANTATAGATTAGASVFQNVAFTSTITLLPGLYFIGVQLDGATDTVRHQLAANGSQPSCTTLAGTFGTVPATITVPTTFTTAVAPISWLYR